MSRMASTFRIPRYIIFLVYSERSESLGPFQVFVSYRQTTTIKNNVNCPCFVSTASPDQAALSSSELATELKLSRSQQPSNRGGPAAMDTPFLNSSHFPVPFRTSAVTKQQQTPHQRGV